MHEDAESKPLKRWETGRVEAFSDGVFAIAITLLVLDIKIGSDDFNHLGHALAHEWPAYLAYVTSFLTVGSVWIAHHNLFTNLRYVDPVLLRLNLLLLMATSFLPFPTSVLAEALHASNTAERTAIIFYGASAILIEVLLRAGIRYAYTKPELLMDGAEDAGEAHHTSARSWQMWVAGATYTVGILVGILVLPKLAVLAYLIVAIRGALVIGGEGQLGLRALFRRRGSR
jgi:uncharacterized membrane protein